ncbi:hypothetical protein C2S53_015784 [Perilla frutescens var. hirtella]|uniref:Uncharacterized protein n=1 Tax=Perilla frutescens var. hirtella TaxID=608512 RepID=A0AAD4P6S3_PERFH|nr:hypothetical protein C2S53_015784 [Perilla frutescens var. hirtella]
MQQPSSPKFSQEGVRRPKKAAEGKSRKTCEVQEDNEKGCDDNRVNELHPNDQSQAQMRRPKKAATETVISIVNSDEDTDPEEIGIEEVDESEFRKRRQLVSEIGSSTWQERNEGYFAATSAKNVNRVTKKIPSTEKNDKNQRKRKVSSYSESKKKVEVVRDEVYSSTSEFTDSHSNSESNSDNVTTSLQDDEVISCGANNGMGLGVASRTRSKMGGIRKPSSIDSKSSPTDSGYHSITCDNFKVESSDDRIELLGSFAEACEVQNNKLVKVSVENDENCSKQGSHAVENASERSLKNLQSKESNCEQSVLESQKFSQEGVRRSKKAAEGKSRKTREVHEDDEKDCDDNGVNELHPNDQSQA